MLVIWYSLHFPVLIRMRSPKVWRGEKRRSLTHGQFHIFQSIRWMLAERTIPMLSVSTASPVRVESVTYWNRTFLFPCRRRCARKLVTLWNRYPTRNTKSCLHSGFTRFSRTITFIILHTSRFPSVISVRKMELWQMQQFSMARIHKSLQEQVMDVLMPSAMRLRIILMSAMSLVSMRSILWQREVLQRQLHMLVLYATEDVIGVLELTTISLRLQLRRWQLQ